jgi:hypothetical protein
MTARSIRSSKTSKQFLLWSRTISSLSHQKKELKAI